MAMNRKKPGAAHSSTALTMGEPGAANTGSLYRRVRDPLREPAY